MNGQDAHPVRQHGDARPRSAPTRGSTCRSCATSIARRTSCTRPARPVGGRPTPTYEAIRDIPDLHVDPASTSVRSCAGAPRSARSTALLGDAAAAVPSFARLAWLVRRRGIRIIHTSDRPRDAFVCGPARPAHRRRRRVVHVHVGYNPTWMSRMLRWSLAPRRRARRRLRLRRRQSLVDGGIRPDRVHVVLNAIDVTGVDARATAGTRCARELGVRRRHAGGRHRLPAVPGEGAGASSSRRSPRARRRAPTSSCSSSAADGRRPTAPSSRQLVAELGVGEHVRFLGRRPDVAAVMAAADVYAMPSHEEPFGLVFLEAMAMRRPVVALADSGTLEVVEHGRSGLLSTWGDIDQLAANLRDAAARSRASGVDGRRTGVDRSRSDSPSSGWRTMSRRLYPLVASRRLVDLRTGNGGIEWICGISAPSRRPMSSGRSTTTASSSSATSSTRDDSTSSPRRSSTSSTGPRRPASCSRVVASLSGHLNCYPGEASRFVWDDIVDHGIVDLVRAIRPDIVDSVRATLNFNLPGSVAQHYHTDGLYLKDFLICNVAVVDTDLENGAIDVLPGTNREFYKFWRYALQRKYRLTTRVPLRQGDVILRKSTCGIGGCRTRRRRPRPMMAITFGEMEDTGCRSRSPAHRRQDRLLPELVQDEPARAAPRAGVRRPRRSPTRPTASPARCTATRATRPSDDGARRVVAGGDGTRWNPQRGDVICVGCHGRDSGRLVQPW